MCGLFGCGVFLLVVSTVMLMINSVSLPHLSNIDLARVRVKSGDITQGTLASPDISELRFGIWSYCAFELPSGNRNCSDNGYGYSVVFLDKHSNYSVTIGSSWTRGLAALPVAAALSSIAMVTSFCCLNKATAVLTMLATFIAFIAFLADVALFIFVKHQVGKLQHSSFQTDLPLGFWISFFSMSILGFASKCFF